LKAAYPMPGRSADSTMMAIKLFKGNKEISRFFFGPLRRDRACFEVASYPIRYKSAWGPSK
ncbi:MAG: hypothetical protein ACKPKO_65410, partial [Candidatus Fonsibacter sp.]